MDYTVPCRLVLKAKEANRQDKAENQNANNNATSPHSTHPLALDGTRRTDFLSSCLGRRTSGCGLLPHSSHSHRTYQGKDLCICCQHKPYPLDSPCSARTLDDTLRKDLLGIPVDMCTPHLHTERSDRTVTGNTSPNL